MQNKNINKILKAAIALGLTAIRNERLEPCKTNLVQRWTVNTLTHHVKYIVDKSTIANMATVWIFQVTHNKCTVSRIFNYVTKLSRLSDNTLI